MAEQTCKHKFQLTCKSKIFGIKSCEMRLETGELLTYMPVPDGMRFCFGTIQRFYESEEGSEGRKHEGRMVSPSRPRFDKSVLERKRRLELRRRIHYVFVTMENL